MSVVVRNDPGLGLELNELQLRAEIGGVIRGRE